MAEYRYQPLPVIEGSDDIYVRLLCLPPGPRLGPIHCSIITALLSNAPHFDAVSYCWGSASDQTEIHITDGTSDSDPALGKLLQVPTSIIPFLYRTRSDEASRDRVLWIDSICINQQDPTERSRQIPKMRDIYATAERTMSWLGPEQDNSNDAFAYAVELTALFRRRLGRAEKNVTPEVGTNLTMDAQVTPGDPRLKALVAIHERPYFQRAWIVQEVAVSQCVMLVCGDAIITMDQFLCAFCYLVMATPWLWEFYPGHLQVFVMRLKWASDDWKNAAATDWLKVLLKYRVYEATDPRDKIYAYYSLRCQDDFRTLGIEPDYKNIDTRTLFTTLAANALIAGQSDLLHVPRLVNLEAMEEGIPIIDLPSWVPDWRYTKQTPSPILNLTEKAQGDCVVQDMKASSSSEVDISFDVSSSSLQKPYFRNAQILPKMIRLRGFEIAIISHTTPLWTMKGHIGQSTLWRQAQALLTYRRRVGEWVRVMDNSRNQPHYEPTNQPWGEALCETVTATTSKGTIEERRNLGAATFRRQRIFGPVADVYRPLALLIFSVVIVIQRVLRTLFGYTVAETRFRWLTGIMYNRRGARCMSDAGKVEYLAIVPGLAMPGDSVMLIQGLRMPLVLRDKARAVITVDGRERKVRAWELLGDCYVHGIMEGQVWEDRKGECTDLWIA